MNGIYDLIYSLEPESKLRELFPEAQFADASDYVHEERFSIAIRDETHVDQYIRWMIENGWADCSLWIGLSQRGEGENRDRLERICREIAADKRATR